MTEVLYGINMLLKRAGLRLNPIEFFWTDEHQQAYNFILLLLVKPAILSLPRNYRLFRLYVNTLKVGKFKMDKKGY